MSNQTIPIHQLDSRHALIIERIEEGEMINFDGIHRHNFFEILFFTNIREHDTHMIDFIRYPLSADSFYILRPGQVYQLDYVDQKGFLVAIHPDVFNSYVSDFLATSLFPNIITLKNEVNEKAQAIRLIEILFHEYSHMKRDILLRSYLESLLSFLEISGRSVHLKKQYDSRISTLINLIEEHFKCCRNVDFYSKRLGVSEKTLNRICLKYLGNSIKKIIQERLLLEAQRKIASGEQSFKEIAFELGFKEASYFTRFFKINCGKTPEEFKNSLLP